MNSKKLLSMLLISLGAFSVVLTGCDGTKNSDSPSDVPSSSTSENTDSVSDSTSITATDSSSETVESSTASDSSESVTVTDSSSGEEVDPNLLGTYDVIFNYDDAKSGLVVWTNEEIERSVAPYTQNISEIDEIATMRTIPTTSEGGTKSGMYYFLINEHGEIAYATYGLGNGYGSPCDGYYFNSDNKNVYDAPFWSLHDKYEFWGTNVQPVEIHGEMVNPWNLFDLVIPEGWFGIKGYYNDPTMKAFWKVISKQNSVPLADNSFLEATIASKSLDHFYVSINEKKQLEISERKEGVTETPNMRYTPTADDALIPYLPLADVAEAENDTVLDLIKGVVTYKTDTTAIITDEKGDSVLVKNELADVVVGDTIVFTAKKYTSGNYVAVKDVTNLEKVERYGKVPQVDTLVVTEENVVEMMTVENNYKPMKLTKAEVISMDANGKSVVKIGETEIVIYKATFPATVSVGDSIDLVGAMISYKEEVQLQVASVDDISRYYNVSVDVDGVDGVEEPVVSAHATGDKVVLSASNADDRYQFSHWEMLTKDEEGNDVWENVSSEVDFEITVGEADVSYRAAFTYSAWSLLDPTYANVLNSTVTNVNKDAAENTTAVLKEGMVLRETLAWNDSNFDVRWKVIIIVDGEGKIAYAVKNPANGYGGPNGQGYYTHPDYDAAGYETNPAIKLLEGYGPWTPEDPAPAQKYNLVVPEGGFAIITHGTAANEILTSFGLADNIAEADFNKRTSIADASIRLFYDEANKNVKVFKNESDPEATVNGLLNVAYDETSALPFVYTNDYADKITLGEMTVATDANGVVVYAGRTSSGYGGPGDGFYHDGSYVAKAGQVCGIFDLQEKWAPWPNKAEIDGEEVNAWTLYSVVVPEGGQIITGSFAAMTDLANTIYGQTLTTAQYASGNPFEGVVDGLHNESMKITYELNSKIANVTATRKTKDPSEITKDYQPITYTDPQYMLNFYDAFENRVNEKLAADGTELASTTVTSIYYDNVDARMWGDSGFSSIVYTSEAAWANATKNAWAFTMIVNAEGKIEWMGQVNNPKSNYYLRAESFDASPAYNTISNTVQIPEGGFAYQQWASANATEGHNIVYTDFDVVRSIAMAQIGDYWFNYGKADADKLMKVPADKVIGDATVGADHAYGHENETIAIARSSFGNININFTNVYTGFLDDLTVTKEAIEDTYFKGKITVTRTDTFKSVMQRALVKTEYVRALMNNAETGDEAFIALYASDSAPKPDWSLNNVIAPRINSYINGEKTYAEVLADIASLSLNTSYVGDIYGYLFAALNAPQE